MPGGGGRWGAGEVLLRLALVLAFCYMETMSPFVRYISPQDMQSVYRHPRRDSYVPARALWSVVVAAPCLAASVGYLLSGDKDDFTQSLLAVSLALGINGVFTNTVKLVAGRPRPDFFYRCFPDGVMPADMRCSGALQDIIDGRKSFPSGHSSFSFCSLGFVSVWLCGRLGVLAARGRTSGLRVTFCLLPLYAALLIALSRSCDYHHHWQDILVGSALGLTTAYGCYRQYYHPLDSELAGAPYRSRPRAGAPGEGGSALAGAADPDDNTPLVNGGSAKLDSKWI